MTSNSLSIVSFTKEIQSTAAYSEWRDVRSRVWHESRLRRMDVFIERTGSIDLSKKSSVHNILMSSRNSIDIPERKDETWTYPTDEDRT